MRRALQKAIAGGDIYGMMEYKNPSTNTFSIVTCLQKLLAFGIWESGVGLQMKIVKENLAFFCPLHGYPPDIRGVDGDDMLLHSRS